MKRKNKKLGSAVFVLLFLTLIGIMDYPFVSALYNERVQGSVVVDYENHIENADEQILEDERHRAEKYNQWLAESNWTLQDAFFAARDESEEYSSYLNLNGDGIMAVIEIPKIDLSLPVYHGTVEKVLQLGAGHLEGSSLPVGGSSTHTCISAHRGLPNKTMFTNLDQMQEGDYFFLKTLGETLAYQVYQVETVEPDHTESLSIQNGEDKVTLITCTPYGLNTHRLYVQGEGAL